jgi:adenine deaminase
MRMPLQLLAVARGDIPADLLLKNGRIINVFSGEIEQADIAIVGDRIAGIGSGYRGKQEIDLDGAYVAPGLIDAHVHIESSLCLPAQFAAAVVPRGVTSVIADPHEIANVCGAAGVQFMADASRGLPLRVVLMAPSCVPATDMATAGAKLDAEDLTQLHRDGVVHGLAEVMNYPGVISGEKSVAAKLDAFRGQPIDGHAPNVRDKQLNAYVAAGIGSDHECVTVEEAREKLARGMYVLIREATNARNLDALLPLVTPANSRRICFCTDDRTPQDLLSQGSVDYMVRRAIAFGIEPVTAFRMATLNTAEWFGLHDRGAIAPGQVADLMIFENLREPHAKAVYASGALVTADGKAKFSSPAVTVPAGLRRTVNLPRNQKVTLDVPARPGQIRVIGSRPDQLITESITALPRIERGCVQADPKHDILKMIVMERHSGSARIGIGFIRGFGLKRGAIAGTVAHDHHNIVAIGCDDRSIIAAIVNIREMGGGLQVTEDDRALAQLPLPIAGLMSDRPIAEVRDGYARLLAAARQLGSTLHDPFMAMSFMALEVIPSLKLTDQGLIDVDVFRRVELFV